MNKSKKYVLAVIIVIIVLAICGVISYKEQTEKEEKSKLIQEINQLNKLISSTKIDTEKVNEIINRTVTGKNYSDVERASKDYLKEAIDSLNILMEAMGNKEVINILTVQNYKKDGPKFTKSKKTISDTRKDLNEQKDKFLSCLDEKAIEKYAEEKGFNEEKKQLFKDLMLGKNSTIEKDRKEFEEAVDTVLKLLDGQEEIIDFLIKNKGKWKITGAQITFESNSLVNKYNDLLKKLQND